MYPQLISAGTRNEGLSKIEKANKVSSPKEAAEPILRLRAMSMDGQERRGLAQDGMSRVLRMISRIQ
jgi:hypothetical protein